MFKKVNVCEIYQNVFSKSNIPWISFYLLVEGLCRTNINILKFHRHFNRYKRYFIINIGFGQLRNTHFRSRSKSPMNFKNDAEKTSDNENRSSFKGRKRLFKTLSLFSTTQMPIEQIKLDLQKACTSSNSVRNNGSRNVDDRKRSFGTKSVG